mmetsp:Transcript_16874/g.27095  ORF Transcript_16874/g.27095 Transcript_16874/m.27095 type:complete len:97 (+) Transcript_16874:1403-1693(+)
MAEVFSSEISATAAQGAGAMGAGGGGAADRCAEPAAVLTNFDGVSTSNIACSGQTSCMDSVVDAASANMGSMGDDIGEIFAELSTESDDIGEIFAE